MKIVIDPRKVLTIESLPPNSLALDGAVAGIQIDHRNRRYSFDHHSGFPRFAISATCRQVLDALLLGLGVSGMTIYLNHLDGDVVLAVWLLEHAERWSDDAMLAKVRPLLDVVAENDAHGPAYPVRNADLASQYHMQILSHLRKDDEGKTDREINETVLASCLDALETWWGAGLPTEPSTSKAEESVYIIEQYTDWVFIRSDFVPGAVSDRRTADLYKQGYKRLLLCSELSPGRWKYTLAKKSDFVDGFDLRTLYAKLNELEMSLGGQGSWGGASTIGGSPRPNGSVLPPKRVIESVENSVLEEIECAKLL